MAKAWSAPSALDDVLIITPYNAQVFEIQQRFPGARIGTVDKFQGQEAPVAIYSLGHLDPRRRAPRHGVPVQPEPAQRRDVPRALPLLVCIPAVVEAECRNPRQTRLANAFCRYLELAG